jgi:23S rRNA pseudouridine1911/1915/1917 synthase
MQRIDIALTAQLPELSRSTIQRAIADGRVRVDGVVVTKAKVMVHPSSKLTIDEAASVEQPVVTIPILYEDDTLLVYNKPIGVATHPGNHTVYPTASVAAVAHDPQIAAAVFEPGNPTSEIRPGIVHRLDRDTSGVLVIAKTREALLHLQQQFQERSVEKTYLAVLFGALQEQREVTAPIVRRGGGSENILRASHKEDTGRPAHTTFIPLQEITTKQGTQIQLVRCLLHTGRTHQIRVHAKFIGHPIIGDERYTNGSATLLSKRLGAVRQLLHAHTLTLTHPVTGKRMSWTAPIPTDIDRLFPSASMIEKGGSDHADTTPHPRHD